MNEMLKSAEKARREYMRVFLNNKAGIKSKYCNNKKCNYIVQGMPEYNFCPMCSLKLSDYKNELIIVTTKNIIDNYFGDVDTPKNDVTLKEWVCVESIVSLLEDDSIICFEDLKDQVLTELKKEK